jgi:hypothetical protein
MSVFLHIVLPIVGRVLAGAVGCLAFYSALFIYEDERNNLQNRLETIWLKIYERAKHTDSLFTALTNVVGTRMVQLFNTIFGRNQFSWKLVAVSVNLSFAFGHFVGAIYGVGGVLGLSLIEFELMQTPSGATLNLIESFLWLGCAAIGIWSSRRWLHIACLAPVMAVCAFNIILELHDDVESRILFGLSIAQPTSLVISVLTDVYAVVQIRRTFNNLAQSPSLTGVLRSVGALIFLAVVVCVMPLIMANYILGIAPIKPPEGLARFWVGILLGDVGNLNYITFVYCALPGVLLVGLLLHKWLWPLLARFTYPLLDFKVLTNRKYLIPIGTVAFALAFGYTTVSDLLKKYLTP